MGEIGPVGLAAYFVEDRLLRLGMRRPPEIDVDDAELRPCRTECRARGIGRAGHASLARAAAALPRSAARAYLDPRAR